MKMLKVYRSLSAEQKRILKTKQISLNRPVGEILTLLKPFAECDTVIDKARTRMGCTSLLALVLIIPAFVVTANLDGHPAGWTAMGVIALVMIGAGWLYFWSRGVDLSNNLRMFILPVLSIIREDIEEGEAVHLETDLRSPTAPAKKTGESKPYKQGVYHKVIDSTYVDPWMTFEAMLSDGTKVWWRITDVIRERKKTKKNPRGKYKTKTKYKKKTTVEIEVGLRRKLYDVTAEVGDQVVAGDKRNVVRITRQHVTLGLDPVAPAAIIDPLAGIYHQARPSRKEA